MTAASSRFVFIMALHRLPTLHTSRPVCSTLLHTRPIAPAARRAALPTRPATQTSQLPTPPLRGSRLVPRATAGSPGHIRATELLEVALKAADAGAEVCCVDREGEKDADAKTERRRPVFQHTTHPTHHRSCAPPWTSRAPSPSREPLIW